MIPKNKDFVKNLKNGGTILFDENEECLKCIENKDYEKKYPVEHKPKSNKTPKIPMKSLDWTKFEEKDIKRNYMGLDR